MSSTINSKQKRKVTGESLSSSNKKLKIEGDKKTDNKKEKKEEKEKKQLFEHKPGFVDQKSSDIYFHQFKKIVEEVTQGKPNDVKVFGKDYKEPRLSAFFNKDLKGENYVYSGVTHKNNGWPEPLQQLSALAESLYIGRKFTRAVVNFYRSKEDCIGAHRDKDSMNSLIVSFTFYPKETIEDEYREMIFTYSPMKKTKYKMEDFFDFKEGNEKSYKKDEKINVVKLKQGDLFTMNEGSQHLTKHAINRVKKQKKEKKKEKQKKTEKEKEKEKELKFWRISVTLREKED